LNLLEKLVSEVVTEGQHPEDLEDIEENTEDLEADHLNHLLGKLNF